MRRSWRSATGTGVMRPGVGSTWPSPSAAARRSTPSAWATASAAAPFDAAASPTSRRRASIVRSAAMRNRTLVRSSESRSQRSTRTSAVDVRPKLRTEPPPAMARRATRRASSAFRTAVPPGPSAAKSDAFSSATASTVPSPSVWAAATIVTTPTSGRVISASRAISPGRLVPISSTAVSTIGPRPRTTMGRPTRLFRLPAVRCTRRPAAESAPAVSSLVEVLPAEPVMHTTRPSQAARCRAARSPRARRVSATSITAASPVGPSAAPCSTSTTAAPPRNASGTKRCASCVSPRNATKRQPGATARESVVTPRTERTAGREAPPRRAQQRVHREARLVARDRRRHQATPPGAHLAMARRASSRSSKARVSVPTIW